MILSLEHANSGRNAISQWQIEFPNFSGSVGVLEYWKNS